VGHLPGSTLSEEAEEMAKNMTMTRRRLLQYGAVSGAALVLPARFTTLDARAALGSPNLTKFIEPLPVPG
jgi:hypothetical protein